MADYIACAPAAASAETVASLAGPGLMRMVHTRDGARVACAVLARGTPKDRKKAVKAMKGHAVTMAKDEWACAPLAAALTFVDDTQLLAKAVAADLAAAAPDLVGHKHARRVFLQLLCPGSPRYLPPHLLELVKPPPAQCGGGTDGGGGGEGGEESDDGEEAGEGGADACAHDGAACPCSGGAAAPPQGGVSKKPAGKRRRELCEQRVQLQVITKATAPGLLPHHAASDVGGCL